MTTSTAVTTSTETSGPAPATPATATPATATPTRTRVARPRVDAVLAAAQEVARAAAEEVAPGQVGAHEGVEADAERVVTHYFASQQRAYTGWRWAVTLARAPRARHVTVDEVVLLPGPGALLPPEWLPWSERLRPGDVGVGDLLPAADDDVRLVPGLAAPEATPDTDTDTDADAAAGSWASLDVALQWELGLGRVRVLSREGRDEAAERWHAGAAGPTARIARAAPEPCSTCGFWWPLAGSLRQAFGVCANAYAPDDGKVVAVDHGCGAHSEIAVSAPATGADPVVDEIGYDVLDPRASAAADEAPEPDADGAAAEERRDANGHPPGSVDGSEPAEELGHS